MSTRYFKFYCIVSQWQMLGFKVWVYLHCGHRLGHRFPFLRWHDLVSYQGLGHAPVPSLCKCQSWNWCRWHPATNKKMQWSPQLPFEEVQGGSSMIRVCVGCKCCKLATNTTNSSGYASQNQVIHTSKLKRSRRMIAMSDLHIFAHICTYLHIMIIYDYDVSNCLHILFNAYVLTACLPVRIYGQVVYADDGPQKVRALDKVCRLCRCSVRHGANKYHESITVEICLSVRYSVRTVSITWFHHDSITIPSRFHLILWFSDSMGTSV